MAYSRPVLIIFLALICGAAAPESGEADWVSTFEDACLATNGHRPAVASRARARKWRRLRSPSLKMKGVAWNLDYRTAAGVVHVYNLKRRGKRPTQTTCSLETPFKEDSWLNRMEGLTYKGARLGKPSQVDPKLYVGRPAPLAVWYLIDKNFIHVSATPSRRTLEISMNVFGGQ